MIYNAKSIGNYFLHLADIKQIPISPIKLQKLVYYANGWHAGYAGTPLIDESIKAMPFGPIIPSLFQEFKSFGSSPINRMGMSLNAQATELVPESKPEDPAVLAFLRNIWNAYASLPDRALSDMITAPGGPWQQYCPRENAAAQDIAFDAIHGYFRDLVKKQKQKTDFSGDCQPPVATTASPRP